MQTDDPDSPARWLTDELWGKIFSNVKADAIETANKIAEGWDSQPMLETGVLFARMHQLKLVCRSFYRIFQRQVELSDWLLLPADLHKDMIPSLLSQAMKTRNTLQKFTSLCGSPYTDITLAALLCPNPVLTEVTTAYICSQTPLIFSAFKSLKKCHFQEPHESVDLTPLQSLPFLEDLQLTTGHFYCLEYAHHLSSLQLTEAVLHGQGACNCVNTLHTLQLLDSSLSGMHTLGLSACTALKTLSCRNSIIEATNPYESCVTSVGAPTRVPWGLRAMYNLTNLLFLFQGLKTGNCCVSGLDWVCTLTNLTSLCLMYDDQTRHVWLGPSLTQLKMLETFEVRAVAEGSIMSLCFAWGLMRSLKSFTFESQEFAFDSDPIGLTRLGQLSRAQFSTGHPVDYAILRKLRPLMYMLARNSPGVSFWLNDYRVESDRCVLIGGP